MLIGERPQILFNMDAWLQKIPGLPERAGDVLAEARNIQNAHYFFTRHGERVERHPKTVELAGLVLATFDAAIRYSNNNRGLLSRRLVLEFTAKLWDFAARVQMEQHNAEREFR